MRGVNGKLFFDQSYFRVLGSDVSHPYYGRTSGIPPTTKTTQQDWDTRLRTEARAPRTTTALEQICTNAAREKPRTIIAEFGKCPIGMCTIFNHVSSECELPPSLPLVAKLSAPPLEHWTLAIVLCMEYGINQYPMRVVQQIMHIVSCWS